MLSSVITIPIADITIGPDRARRDLGDLPTLAASIDQIGLLQPPVINTANKLICGLRRIRAVESLGWTQIEARVVDLAEVVLGEFAENEFRKDFTRSERVSIAKAMEEAIGNRAGRPSGDDEIRRNCDEFSEGERTKDFVAKRTGFGSKDSLARAESVVENGIPELVEAMDKEEVSIAAAAEIAALPTEEQQAVVAEGAKAIRGKASELRSGRKRSTRAADSGEPESGQHSDSNEDGPQEEGGETPPAFFDRIARWQAFEAALEAEFQAWPAEKRCVFLINLEETTNRLRATIPGLIDERDTVLS
jgi:ParB family chromosome partitioning protein